MSQYDKTDVAAKLSGRTAQLRRLAAHAAYAVDGVWPCDDPWPDRIDSLCEELRALGDKARDEETV